MTMNSKIQQFRRVLAEQGQELTIEQASEVYRMAKSVMKKAKNMSLFDLWNLENREIKEMPEDQKKQIINLYRSAKEML